MIELIHPEERIPLEVAGATFFVRRISVSDVRAINDSIEDDSPYAYSLAIMEHCLQDWDGIQVNGEPVAFSKDKIAWLPATVGAEIAEHCQQLYVQAQSKKKKK